MNVTQAQLRAFLAVAERASFTAAAAALGVSQPALSRTIRGIEDALGARLFDRHTRKLSLTPAGAELAAVARRIAAEVDRGFSDFADFLGGRRGRITISILPSVATALFPSVTRRFRDAHPDVLIRIRDGSQEPVLDDVVQGRADFAVAMQPPPGGDLHFEPLFADEFVFVGSAEDAGVAKAGRVPWTVFRDRPFIALSVPTSIRRMTDAAFQQVGLDIAPAHECGHPATVLSLAEAGLGVTALPRLTLPAALGPALVARDLEPPTVSRSIGIVTRIGRSRAPAADRLIRMLTEEAARRRATRSGQPECVLRDARFAGSSA